MSLHLETQEAFQSLGLTDVPGDWVSSAWEQSFCETVPLPMGAEENGALSVQSWAKAVRACQQWVGEKEGEKQQQDEGEMEGDEEQGKAWDEG